MSDNKEFKYLGQFISKEEKSFGNVDKYIIVYKQPAGKDPEKEWKHNAIISDLSDDAILMIEEMSAGDKFCVTQTKDSGGFPVITNVSDAKDVPARSANGPNQWKSGSKSDWKPKDETGIAIGAAWTNAIEILKLEGGTPTGESTLEIVGNLAWEIVTLKIAQEDKLRASKVAKAEVAEKKAETPKQSRAEQIKAKKAAEATREKAKAVVNAEEIEEDDLDNIDFGEGA